MDPQDENIQQQHPDNQFLANKEQTQEESPIQKQDNPTPHVGTKKQSKIKTKRGESKKFEKGVEDNPEYFRVDYEITHKLYQIYRRLKLGQQQLQSFSFEEKQQGYNTMNYHKIMEMFKDINFKLQINQKLQILRAIKKFCFNPNFINEEEFIKIFKVVVHGIGVKQIAFKSIIATKFASIAQKQAKANNYRRAIRIRLNKNFGQKLKTQAQMQESKASSNAPYLQKEQKSFQTILNADNSYLKKLPSANPSIVIEEAGHPSLEQSGVKTNRKYQSRKKMLTQVSRYEGQRGQKGYLNRAIQKNKLGKITWQNLFKMTEDNMHYNISIPSFISQDVTLNDLQL